jgi:hypothetical protein
MVRGTPLTGGFCIGANEERITLTKFPRKLGTGVAPFCPMFPIPSGLPVAGLGSPRPHTQKPIVGRDLIPPCHKKPPCHQKPPCLLLSCDRQQGLLFPGQDSVLLGGIALHSYLLKHL